MDKHSTEITVTMTCAVAMVIIAQIQLASRHPNNVGLSREVAEDFARSIQQIVVHIMPEHAVLLEMGWNSEHDINQN